MRQILLIFRKDCRHFWLEILVSLLLYAAFVAVYPSQWRTADPSAGLIGIHLDLRHLQMLAALVTGLLPLAWLVVTARVVHDENLLGGRQFWLTRPYDWRMLLLAKSLFLFTFLCVPFTLAQAALLARAGYSPLHYIPNLAYNLLLITGAIILPLFALATVLSTLVRILGTFLVAAVLAAAVAFMASTFTFESDPTISIPLSDRFSLPLIILFCVAVLVLQYAKRKPWTSRGLLVAAVAAVILVAANPFEARMLDHFYPVLAADDHPPLTIAFANDGFAGNSFPGVGTRTTQSVELVLVSSTVPTGRAYEVNNVRLVIDTADGTHYTSSWQALYNQYLIAGETHFDATVAVNKSVYQRIKSVPTSLHAEFSITELSAGTTLKSVLPADDADSFLLRGIGICDAESHDFYSAYLHCRPPFHQPHLAYVSATLLPQPCDPQAAPLLDAPSTAVWTGALDNNPADFGFTPVWNDFFGFSDPQIHTAPANGQRPYPPAICPGTIISVTPYNLVRRFRYSLSTPDILLTDPKGPATQIGAPSETDI